MLLDRCESSRRQPQGEQHLGMIPVMESVSISAKGGDTMDSICYDGKAWGAQRVAKGSLAEAADGVGRDGAPGENDRG